MTPLTDLISRVESATEGSRELDIRIHSVVTGQPLPHLESIGAYGHGWTPYPADWPLYTTSLDAALTLVPEGWFWRVGRTSIYQAWAGVNQTHPDHGEPGRNEFFFKRELWEPPSTPALALCAAALRAHAAMEGADG